MRVLIAALLLSTSAGYANQEITVELPGGAAMEMVLIEPGTFTMGTPVEEIEEIIELKHLQVAAIALF